MAESAAILPFLTAAVSAVIGGTTVWLALRKRSDEDAMSRATRRTSALQLLSDEEYTLTRVRDECAMMRGLIMSRADRLGADADYYAREAERIHKESQDLLAEVRQRRKEVAPRIQQLAAADIEGVIAQAYHGKVIAEAQLQRTLLTKSDLLRSYGLYEAKAAG